jgi:hypothetical protein
VDFARRSGLAAPRSCACRKAPCLHQEERKFRASIAIDATRGSLMAVKRHGLLRT